MGSAYLSSWSTRPRVLSAAAMWPPRKTAAMPREPSLRASGSAEKRSESRLLRREGRRLVTGGQERGPLGRWCVLVLSQSRSLGSHTPRTGRRVSTRF